MYKLFLSPAGRIDRKAFWLALAGFTLLAAAFNFILGQLGNSTLAFLVSLPFPFIALQMIYSIYGKRLHDMGRSVWPLTGMIVSLILVAIIVMMIYGGSEYFSEFAQYQRKEDIDPAVQKAIQERYQARLAEGNGTVSAIMWGIIAVFTLWTGLSKSQPGDNQYGPAPE